MLETRGNKLTWLGHSAFRITTRDLRAALDALEGGKSVPVAETKAFGCTIKRVSKGG